MRLMDSKALPPMGKVLKLATTACSSMRWPPITTNSSMVVLPKNRPTVLDCELVDGSKKPAKFRPICRPISSPASSTEANTMRTARPMATPTTTCWITTPKACGSVSATTGCSGRPAWAHSATSIASATRVRIGTERDEKMGAEENTARMRRNGQNTGETSAMICASVKVGMSAQPLRSDTTCPEATRVRLCRPEMPSPLPAPKARQRGGKPQSGAGGCPI